VASHRIGRDGMFPFSDELVVREGNYLHYACPHWRCRFIVTFRANKDFLAPRGLPKGMYAPMDDHINRHLYRSPSLRRLPRSMV
jgi:hypothetical protein